MFSFGPVRVYFQPNCYLTLIFFCTVQHLLSVSHRGPVKPNLHSQRKSFSLDTHCPSFWHSKSLQPHFLTFLNTLATSPFSENVRSSGLSRKFSSSDSTSRMHPWKLLLAPVLWKLNKENWHVLLAFYLLLVRVKKAKVRCVDRSATEARDI